MAQRHLISELLSWLAIAALLFVFANNMQSLRRVMADLSAARTTPVDRTRHASADDTPAIAATERSRDGVTLQADRSGHFAAALEVNGRPVDAMVDTGATLVMLTYDSARAAGLFLRDQDFTMRMNTANGISRAAPVMLDRVAIGSILVRNVQAGVAEPGAMNNNLLGMSFLRRLQKFEIRSGTLVLQE